MTAPSDRYREVARLFREAAGDAPLTVTPATLDEVTAAQQALGCQFPDSYVWFQLEFGHVPNGALDVYTVKTVEPPHRGLITINLDERRDARPRLPSHLIAFSDSGGGDFCCFDTSALRDGECPIVWWDHESDEDQDPELAAPSFLDWIDSELRERAAEEKGSLLDSLGHVHRTWMREWFKKEK